MKTKKDPRFAPRPGHLLKKQLGVEKVLCGSSGFLPAEVGETAVGNPETFNWDFKPRDGQPQTTPQITAKTQLWTRQHQL